MILKFHSNDFHRSAQERRTVGQYFQKLQVGLKNAKPYVPVKSETTEKPTNRCTGALSKWMDRQLQCQASVFGWKSFFDKVKEMMALKSNNWVLPWKDYAPDTCTLTVGVLVNWFSATRIGISQGSKEKLSGISNSKRDSHMWKASNNVEMISSFPVSCKITVIIHKNFPFCQSFFNHKCSLNIKILRKFII